MDALSALLGLGEDTLSWRHMAARAVVVFVAALTMVRIGDKRFLGKSTAFDVILGVILGSVVSRAITGQSPFVPTLVAALVLVGMHWLLAWIAFRSDRFGTLVKGRTRTLVRDGELQEDAMRKSHVSRDDLRSALRTEASLEDVGDVKVARLERSGSVSVIERDDPSPPPADRGAPRVVEIEVAEGVQRVRIELG